MKLSSCNEDTHDGDDDNDDKNNNGEDDNNDDNDSDNDDHDNYKWRTDGDLNLNFDESSESSFEGKAT